MLSQTISGKALVDLICDGCTAPVRGTLINLDELPGFDPATAGALCVSCGYKLERLMANRRRDPGAYRVFFERCAESIARKLGVIPQAN